jgi:acyl dehydratase
MKQELAPVAAMGTYEEGRSWIGRKIGPRTCEDEVTWPAIKHYCALVRDASENYWDESAARARYGGIVAPPGMLLVWQKAPLWRPDGAVGTSFLASSVPLPASTLINVSTESEFLLPIRVGDRLTVEEEVIEVSPEKRTALGPGHFVTTLATFRNQAGEVVATNRNVMLRYRAGGDGA